MVKMGTSQQQPKPVGMIGLAQPKPVGMIGLAQPKPAGMVAPTTVVAAPPPPLQYDVAPCTVVLQPPPPPPLPSAGSSSSGQPAPPVPVESDGVDRRKKPCTFCGDMYLWRKMWSQKVHDDTQPDVWGWRYKCMPCVKRDECFSTDQEAWSWIYEMNGTANAKRIQVEKFKHAISNVKETFDCIGVHKGKREIYQLSRAFMMNLFSDLAECILLKARQMKAMELEDEECKRMVEELRKTKDPARVKILVDEIDKHMGTEIPQLSFGGREEMLYAAAYTDPLKLRINYVHVLILLFYFQV
jgi:hypothetical protein